MNARQLVFVQPLNPTLEKLKEVIEDVAEKENIEIYEVDTIQEIAQLMPSIGQALYIFGNPKKCASVLQVTKRVVQKLNIKVIALSKQQLQRKALDKFGKIGLTECIVEPVAPKTLLHKVKLLLRSIKVNTTPEDYDTKSFKNEEEEEESSNEAQGITKIDQKKEAEPSVDRFEDLMGPETNEEKEVELDYGHNKSEELSEEDKKAKLEAMYAEEDGLQQDKEFDEIKKNILLDDDVNMNEDEKSSSLNDSDGFDFGELGATGDKEELGGKMQGSSTTEELSGNMVGKTGGSKEELGGSMQGSNSKEDELGGNMQGSNSGQEELGGNMQGSNSKEDDLDANMKGSQSDNKDLGGNMQGSNSANEETDSNMSGKSSTDELSGGLKGDVSKEAQAKDKMEGAIESGNLDDSNGSNKSNFKEDSIDGQMKGKNGSTDKLDANWDGANEAFDSGPSEMSGKTEQKEELEKYYKNNSQDSDEKKEKDKLDENNIEASLDLDEKKKKAKLNFDDDDQRKSKKEELEDKIKELQKKKEEALEKKKAGIVNKSDKKEKEDKTTNAAADKLNKHYNGKGGGYVDNPGWGKSKQVDIDESEKDKLKKEDKIDGSQADYLNNKDSKDKDFDELKNDDDFQMAYNKKDDLGEQTIDYSKFSEEDGGFSMDREGKKSKGAPTYESDELGLDQEISELNDPTAVDEFGAIYDEPDELKLENVENIIKDDSIKANPNGIDTLIETINLYMDKDKVARDFYKHISNKLYQDDKALTVFFSKDSKKISEKYNHFIEKKFDTLGNNLTEKWSSLKDTNIEKWEQAKLPYWSDETFESEENIFFYPFFDGLNNMGFAVVYFFEKVLHNRSKAIEVILESLRGVYLEEFEGTAVKVEEKKKTASIFNMLSHNRPENIVDELDDDDDDDDFDYTNGQKDNNSSKLFKKAN